MSSPLIFQRYATTRPSGSSQFMVTRQLVVVEDGTNFALRRCVRHNGEVMGDVGTLSQLTQGIEGDGVVTSGDAGKDLTTHRHLNFVTINGPLDLP